jgi:putative membrane protein
MEETKLNKDLILREKLAIERTVMANQRTFLSFLRTSLYFSIAGLTINELLVLKHGTIVVVVFFIISLMLLIAGIATYFKQRKKIANSRKEVGGKVDVGETSPNRL